MWLIALEFIYVEPEVRYFRESFRGHFFRLNYVVFMCGVFLEFSLAASVSAKQDNPTTQISSAFSSPSVTDIGEFLLNATLL